MEYKNIMWDSFESNNNQYLLLDTETTGLDTSKCHILQISFLITDYKFDTIAEIYDTIIDVGSIQINNYECHGITNERCRIEGISIIESLEILYEYLQCTTHLIIYNASYDLNILKTELERFKYRGYEELGNKILEELNLKKIICPMRELKGIFSENNKRGNNYSKLSNTYEKIVGKEITNAHNSKYDVLNMLEIMKILYNEKEIYKNMKPKINSLTIKELKAICKSKGIKNYSKKNKQQLIEELT